jgi:hypothetical protein
MNQPLKSNEEMAACCMIGKPVLYNMTDTVKMNVFLEFVKNQIINVLNLKDAECARLWRRL